MVAGGVWHLPRECSADDTGSYCAEQSVVIPQTNTTVYLCVTEGCPSAGSTNMTCRVGVCVRSEQLVLLWLCCIIIQLHKYEKHAISELIFSPLSGYKQWPAAPLCAVCEDGYITPRSVNACSAATRNPTMAVP